MNVVYEHLLLLSSWNALNIPPRLPHALMLLHSLWWQLKLLHVIFCAHPAAWRPLCSFVRRIQLSCCHESEMQWAVTVVKTSAFSFSIILMFFLVVSYSGALSDEIVVWQVILYCGSAFFMPSWNIPHEMALISSHISLAALSVMVILWASGEGPAVADGAKQQTPNTWCWLLFLNSTSQVIWCWDFPLRMEIPSYFSLFYWEATRACIRSSWYSSPFTNGPVQGSATFIIKRATLFPLLPD